MTHAALDFETINDPSEGPIRLHNAAAFEGMRKAGDLVARLLDMLTPHVVPDAVTLDLDRMAYDFTIAAGAASATMFYRGFSHNLCISVNHVVCHGIPSARKLKDGDGQYLWTPGYGTSLKDGLAPTILGHPYFTAEDWTSIASNAYAVGFGSFKAGYRIVDRVDLEITRDDLTQAATGKVRFVGRFRTGGQVVLPEAIRTLKLAAS